MKILSIISAFLCSILLSFHAQAQDPLLTAVGGLSAQSMYVTYLSVGMIADAHSKEVYSNDDAVELLDEIITMTTTVQSQLQTLVNQGKLTRDDANYVKESLEIYTLLIGEASAYKNYVRTGTRTYITTYDQNRKSAWSKMSTIFGWE